MKNYLFLGLLCFTMNHIQAQFPISGTWTNNLRYTSGVDAGMYRVSQKLVFTTQGDDVTLLKMVEPCSHIGYRANGALKFDVEGGQAVNNVRNPYDLWQSIPGRRLMLYGQYNLPDSSANGRVWGRLVFRMLALYKNGGDSTKLIVAEKVHFSRYTKDGKSPRIDGGSVKLDDMYRIGQLVDSVVFTGSPGTNTGANLKAMVLKLNPSQALPGKIILTPTEKARLDEIIKKVKESEEMPVSDQLNANRNSSLFEFRIKSVETLQTDNESCEPQEYKNRAEYLGALTADIWVDPNMKRFNIGQFFDYKGVAVGSPQPCVLALNEKKPITANLNTITTVAKTEFDKATLRISGFLSEVNYTCNGTDANYVAVPIQAANEFTSVYLKDLKSGDNTIDIKKNINGKTITFRIHFLAIEKN